MSRHMPSAFMMVRGHPMVLAMRLGRDLFRMRLGRSLFLRMVMMVFGRGLFLVVMVRFGRAWRGAMMVVAFHYHDFLASLHHNLGLWRHFFRRRRWLIMAHRATQQNQIQRHKLLILLYADRQIIRLRIKVSGVSLTKIKLLNYFFVH